MSHRKRAPGTAKERQKPITMKTDVELTLHLFSVPLYRCITNARLSEHRCCLPKPSVRPRRPSAAPSSETRRKPRARLFRASTVVPLPLVRFGRSLRSSKKRAIRQTSTSSVGCSLSQRSFSSIKREKGPAFQPFLLLSLPVSPPLSLLLLRFEPPLCLCLSRQSTPPLPSAALCCGLPMGRSGFGTPSRFA